MDRIIISNTMSDTMDKCNHTFEVYAFFASQYDVCTNSPEQAGHCSKCGFDTHADYAMISDEKYNKMIEDEKRIKELRVNFGEKVKLNIPVIKDIYKAQNILGEEFEKWLDYNKDTTFVMGATSTDGGFIDGDFRYYTFDELIKIEQEGDK